MFVSSIAKRSLVKTISAVLVLALTFASAAEGAKKKKHKKGENDGVLAGQVRNQQGETLSEVQVTIAAADPAVFSDQVTSDKNGEFEIVIPDAAGDYKVRLTRQGYAPFEVDLSYLEGEQKDIEFTLLDEAAGRRQQAVAAYNAGVNAFNAGDRATAKEKFLAAVTQDSALAEALLPLADILLSDGDYEQAAARAESYLAIKPGDQKAQVIAHEAYRRLGNQAKVEEYRAALGETGLATQLAVQVFNEGAHASQADDWQKAEAKFREAVELDPSLAAAHAALAGAYYNREAFDEALTAAEKVLELDPENVQGRLYRYLVADAQGDPAATEAALDAYAEVDRGGAVQRLYRRADRDFRSGNVEPARAALLRVLKLDPEMARAHYTLGLAYASTDTAKAKQHLQKFIELAPDDPEVASAKEMISYF